ncbi:NAD(P)H-dependent glycerol-3-phosphate dehydrogenase [Escherichia coli]
MKNVIAIGAGMSDGIGFGANARTALITRGLAEMSRLGAALGADPATFMGMAGLGDRVLTCTDNQSRNRRFGMMLGRAWMYKARRIGQVVEGYRNTKEVRELAHRFGVEMPITEEIYQVLYCGKNARSSIDVIRPCTQGRAQQPLTPGNLCYRYDPARAERAGHYLIVWSKQCRVKNWKLSGTILKPKPERWRTVSQCWPVFTTRRYSSTKTLEVH